MERGTLMSAALISVPTGVSVPGEALFADPVLSRKAVGRALHVPDGRILGISAVQRRRLAGRRSAYDIVLTIQPDGGARPERRRLRGKVFLREEGARAFQVLKDLWARGFSTGICRVPKPLGYDPDSRLLLLEWVEGRLLRDIVLEDRRGAAVERAAAWLTALHRSGTTRGRAYTFERHLHTLRAWSETLGEHCPGARPVLSELRSWIETRGKAVSGWTSGPTHRDFSPDHLLVSARVLTGLDFDEFCQYDRLLDVAHFAVHVRCLSFELPHAAARLSELATRFCAAYRAMAPGYSSERFALYTVLSYIKLAHITAAVTRPPDWATRTTYLLNAAARAAEETPCE